MTPRGRRIPGLGSLDPDVQAELQAHIDARMHEHVREGDTPDVARRKAEARFGSMSRLAREATRIRRGPGAWRPRLSEVRQAVRNLRRSPWYAATIVGVMSLAMALGTTVFAVVDGVLFKPLPYPAANQLYGIEPGFKGLTLKSPSSASENEVAGWSAALPDVPLTAFRVQPWGGLGAGVNDDVAGMALVQQTFFDVIGVHPLLGGLAPADFARKTTYLPVVALYDVWQHRFGGDPGVIGRRFDLTTTGDAGYRIVGVMPPGFVFPTDRWDVSFIGPHLASYPDVRDFLQMVARVPPSMSPIVLSSRLEGAMQAFAAARPPRGPKPAAWSDRAWRAQGPFDRAAVIPLSSELGRTTRPLFTTAFAAVILIVVLGALNASGLMASRVLDRRAELDLRRALGATPVAIGRLLVIESLVLLTAGAIVGICLAPAMLAIIRSLLPEDLILMRTPAIDWRVSAFVALSVAALLLPTSAWPIWRAVREPRVSTAAGRTATAARSIGRHLVIGVQVAGAFALTVTGALLLRSLLLVYASGHPIQTDHVVLLEGMVDGPGATMSASPERTARIDPILERLRETPGVKAVGLTAAEVLRGGNWGSPFRAPAGAANARLDVDIQPVTAGYFQVVKPALVAGRWLTDDELRRGTHAIVVSEGVGRAYWPKMPALGLTLVQDGDPEPFTVVGVVKDVRWQSWDMESASIYGPYRLLARSPMFTFLAQSSGDAGQLMHDGIEAVSAADPHVRIRRAALLDTLFVDSVQPRRFRAWLFGSFAVAALAVVGVGIFGLLAMAAARRTREIGIRRALGATRAHVTRALVREPATAVVAGLAAGGFLASWGAHVVASGLYGVTAADPVVWSAAAAVILLVAACGAIAPAIRASRADVVQALRAD